MSEYTFYPPEDNDLNPGGWGEMEGNGEKGKEGEICGTYWKGKLQGSAYSGGKILGRKSIKSHLGCGSKEREECGQGEPCG